MNQVLGQDGYVTDKELNKIPYCRWYDRLIIISISLVWLSGCWWLTIQLCSGAVVIFRVKRRVFIKLFVLCDRPVRVVFRKIIVGDWRFDYLSSGSSESSESRHQMQVFMPLVMVSMDWSVLLWCHWSSKCGSCSDWLVVVLLLFSIHLLFAEVCWFHLRSGIPILT